MGGKYLTFLIQFNILRGVFGFSMSI